MLFRNRLKLKKIRMSRKSLGYVVVAICFIVVGLFAPTGLDYYGAWSMLPALCMFTFTLLTKAMVESFLWSGILAVFIKYRWDFFETYCLKIKETVTTDDKAYLLLVFLLLGVLVVMLEKSGAATYFARKAAAKAKNAKVAMLITWVMSWVLCVDDYLCAFVTGAAMAPVNDKYGIPREATGYIIRSSAVHTGSLIPIGDWVIFGATLMQTYNFAGEGEGVGAYMKCVPFFFYSFISLIFGFLFCIGKLPKFGQMKKAYQRVEEGGPVIPPSYGSDEEEETETTVEGELIEPRKGVNMLSFIIPIAVMIGACTYFDFDMQLGLTFAIFATAILFVVQKIFKPGAIFGIVVEGFCSMMYIVFMQTMDFTMTGTVSELGFTEFVVGAVKDVLDPSLFPIAVYMLFCGTEFLVTFNWTLYILVMPSLIVLSSAIGANTYLVLAAMFSAGLFGSNASFTSDAGMCNAAAVGLDLYDHNYCCMQYSVVVFILSAVCYLVAGFVC